MPDGKRIKGSAPQCPRVAERASCAVADEVSRRQPLTRSFSHTPQILD